MSKKKNSIGFKVDLNQSKTASLLPNAKSSLFHSVWNNSVALT